MEYEDWSSSKWKDQPKNLIDEVVPASCCFGSSGLDNICPTYNAILGGKNPYLHQTVGVWQPDFIIKSFGIINNESEAKNRLILCWCSFKSMGLFSLLQQYYRDELGISLKIIIMVMQFENYRQKSFPWYIKLSFYWIGLRHSTFSYKVMLKKLTLHRIFLLHIYIIISIVISGPCFLETQSRFQWYEIVDSNTKPVLQKTNYQLFRRQLTKYHWLVSMIRLFLTCFGSCSICTY